MVVNGSATLDTFYSAHVRWTQPTYVAVCPSGSRNAMWAGLGGTSNSTSPAQSGSDLEGSTLNGAIFWWELIFGNFDTHEVKFAGLTPSPGDYIGTTTRWDSSQQGFWFYFYDYSTGYSSQALVTSVGTVPMVNYYDGTTADFISESPTNVNTGLLWNLRKPSSGTISFPYALANSQGISNFSSWRTNTTPSAGGYKQTTNFDGIHAWADSWQKCS